MNIEFIILKSLIILLITFILVFPIIKLHKFVKPFLNKISIIYEIVLALIMIIYVYKPAMAISCNLLVFSFFQSLLSDYFFNFFGMYKEINIKGEKQKINNKNNFNKITLTNVTLCFSIFNLIYPRFYSFFKKIALKNTSTELTKILPFLSPHWQLFISICYQYILIWYIVIAVSLSLLPLEKRLISSLKQHYVATIRDKK